MIQILLQADKIDLLQWKMLVEASSVASVFQTKECYDFYDSLSFMEAFCVGVEENGVLKGIIIGYIQKDGGQLKQFFSRRAIINGGPLLAEDISDEALGELLFECKRLLRERCIFVEIRNLNDYSQHRPVFEKYGFAYEAHLDFIVDTSSLEEIEKRMQKRRRQRVHAAIRDGLEIVTDPSLEDIQFFYSQLREFYKSKVKTPLFPYEFFEKLFLSEMGKILIIKFGNEIVGGQVCLCLKGKTVYELFMCGQDAIYKKLNPSTLATFSGIQYAAKNGYSKCDMMGAGKPNEPYGVRDFKESFGGELVEFGRYKYICNRFLYMIGCLGIKILRKKP